MLECVIPLPRITWWSKRPPKWIAILLGLVGVVIILASIYGYATISH